MKVEYEEMLLKKKIWDLNFHFAKFLSFWKLQEINPEFSRVQLNFVTKSSDVNSHVISVKTNESKLDKNSKMNKVKKGAKMFQFESLFTAPKNI